MTCSDNALSSFPQVRQVVDAADHLLTHGGGSACRSVCDLLTQAARTRS
jgi:3-deoxy-D-manno-octulosonate 8-phosphate phosphatase KdsC-like HAD superfamily phosphatase